MRKMMAAGVAMVLASGEAALAAGAPSPAALLERFAAHFASRDVAAQAALFQPEASFFGSSVPGLLRGQEGARAYFQQAWGNAAPATVTCAPASLQQAAPGLVLFATTCQLQRGEQSRGLRLSGAMQQDAEGWRFANLHVSAAPAPR